MQSNGTLSPRLDHGRRGSPSTPRSTRCRTSPAPRAASARPASTATAASTGTLVTLAGTAQRAGAIYRVEGTDTRRRARPASASSTPPMRPLSVPTTRETALFESGAAFEQRPEARPGCAACSRPARVGARHRLVDLGAPPLIARHQLRGPLARAARGEQRGTRQRQLQRAGLPRERPRTCSRLRCPRRASLRSYKPTPSTAANSSWTACSTAARTC